ncbi:hypothetical protein PC118_g25526 [Phytophthora cactorum]|uniref:Uncharacterized protein n=1 Tax=Phytophthora cactorum TaxID=29920 RepID=A0A8T1E3R4_9STRA|nr:hypothetical protein PC112_g23520 [Phytophthora cactorum]KAG2947983.1 hypothetical protein PC118_g25526 [Phytophthora cactorum]
MQARPVSAFLRPQRSTHIHAMLSSEIVRPVFQPNIAARRALRKPLECGVTRSDGWALLGFELQHQYTSFRSRSLHGGCARK